MGGYQSTLNNETTKVTSIVKHDMMNMPGSSSAQPIDSSYLVSLYNEKGFIKFTIESNAIKEYVTTIWRLSGLDKEGFENTRMAAAASKPAPVASKPAPAASKPAPAASKPVPAASKPAPAASKPAPAASKPAPGSSKPPTNTGIPRPVSSGGIFTLPINLPKPNTTLADIPIPVDRPYLVNVPLQNDFVYKQMKTIVTGPINIQALMMPLLIGSNSGLYSVVKPNVGDTNISILIPQIIFTENYYDYFSGFRKVFSLTPDKNQEILPKLIGSINKKGNYKIINSQIKLFNIINLLLRLALVYQLKSIYFIGSPVLQENMSNIFIDEITNIINLIPSDKCYSNNGLIKMYPNLCLNNEAFTNTEVVANINTSSSCNFWIILVIFLLAYLYISKKHLIN